jgi:hypothetical protein
MAETKYGKHILRGARKETGTDKPGVKTRTLEEPEDWSGIHHRLNWKYITQPVILGEEPHSHDFDEFLCFTTLNPAEPKVLGAEIELSLGKEEEKHIINTPSVVCIPKGMVHSPVNFKKVDKPVLFCNIYLSPEYVRKPA